MMGVLCVVGEGCCGDGCPPLRFAKGARASCPPPFASPAKGRISPPLPVIPADAGIQGHKNNRLPRAALVGPVRLRGSGVLCFTLGSRVRGNDVAVAGMTEVSPE